MAILKPVWRFVIKLDILLLYDPLILSLSIRRRQGSRNLL